MGIIFLYFTSWECSPHRMRQDHNNSITEEPTCRLYFSLTSLQQCTAVTDIYFIVRKVQPYLLNLRWGGQERGRKAHSGMSSQTNAQNWCPVTETTFPNGGDFPSLGIAAEGVVATIALSTPSPVPLSISIFYQMALSESGIITITYKLLLKLKVTKEKEYQE